MPSSADPHIVREVVDGILVVTLDRPEKKNALTFEMLRALAASADELRDDDSLRVLLIRARGKFFSAGLDVTTGLAPETPSGIEFRDWYRRTVHTLFDELEAIEKPVVAAIGGTCLGGALEMSLSCDFRLASASAQFGLPETNLGALPGSGGVSRLTRIVGTAEAKWLVMAARTIDADRALRVGLVHDVYPDDGFDERALEFARGLTSLPREVLGAAKVTIDLAHDLDRASARHVERLANTPLSQSAEHRALLQAFLNRKR